YFSLDPDLLFLRLKCKLEDNMMKFQSEFCLPIYVFLDLIKLYLACTVVSVNGKLFIQKKGVCIGSSIAPFLAEIYLGSLDELCLELMSEFNVHIFRYVDDILLLGLDKSVLLHVINVIKSKIL